ncbi:taste receptor type 2 member 40-like [Discoglossus pictus]
MTLGFSDSSAKQERLDCHHLETGLLLKVWGQELPSQRSVNCQTVLYIEDVTTHPFYVVIFIIWIHISNQKSTTSREIKLFNLRSQQKIRIQTATRCTMLPVYVIVSLSAMSISTLIGFLTNSFIIVAHGMDRAKSRNINPRELILFTLGLFNIAFQCSMAANDTVLYLWSDLYFSDNVYAIFSVILLFTIFSSFWFTFCLCGFYYIMLVTSEQTFFMRVKQSISGVVPWMLVASVLLSLIISVPVAWNITKHNYSIAIDGNVTYNSTVELSTPHMSLRYLLVSSIIGCCVPLVLVAIANILIIKSLCVHAKQLGRNAGGMNVQSVDASVSAARTVTSLLLLYISFYVSQILLIMGVFDVESLWFSVGLVVIYAYSPVQSVILILGSPKLKSTLVRLLGLCKPDKTPHKKLNATTYQIFSVQSNSGD